MITPHRTLQMALDALDNLGSMSDHDVTPYAWHGAKAEAACAALREALAQPAPEPVAWKHDCAALCTNDVELWIDACPHCGKPRTTPPAAPAPVVPDLKHCACEFDGDTCVTQCKLHAAHVDAIHEWAERAKAAEGKLSAAPVPLTDTETHAELWKLAVRKGLITVRSELIDPRNHGTRVSWMQGHDKACDISNDAAAHGIAASPAAPAAPVVPLTDERITKALRRAFSLGQTYWQQADSDSYTQNAKSDETRQKFETLIVETLNGITGGSK